LAENRSSVAFELNFHIAASEAISDRFLVKWQEMLAEDDYLYSVEVSFE